MRFLPTIPVLAVLMAGLYFPSPSLAQSWEKYVNRDLQFTINVPRAPRLGEEVFVAANGTKIPAQTFSLEDGSAFYKLSVVDFSEHLEAEPGALSQAVENMLRRGEGRHNPYAYMDGLSGHDFNLYQPNGRRLQATIYLFDHRLYIIEGSDLREEPPPSRFTYSLIITDADGTQLNLDRYNSESFNAFEGAGG